VSLAAPVERLLRRTPVTAALIGVTTAVFVLQLAIQQLAGVDLLLALGAKWGAGLRAGEVWRLVTPLFLHAGPLHLFVNMYSLFALGPVVERFFGRPRFLALYLMAGVSGVVLSLALSPQPSVGASGAIFGLLGALAAFLYLHRPVFGPGGEMMLRQLLIVGAINLAYGALSQSGTADAFGPRIDLWGHVGGLAAGAACATTFGPHLTPVLADGGRAGLADGRPWRDVRTRVLIAGLGLAAAAAVAVLVGA